MKLNQKIFYCFIIFLFIFGISTMVINPALAAECKVNQTEGGDGIWEKMEKCRDCGDCELNDFVQLLVNVAGWLLGITGSLALLAFVYGGVMFLISAGSSERVTQARQILIGAVIGIAIVFLSYTIIGFIFKTTGVKVDGTAWSNTGWFK